MSKLQSAAQTRLCHHVSSLELILHSHVKDAFLSLELGQDGLGVLLRRSLAAEVTSDVLALGDSLYRKSDG
jgi:hypothetical protein